MYEPGTGTTRVASPWFARQGWVFSAPDPDDPIQVYMVERGAAVQIVALQSFHYFLESQNAAICADVAALPGYDIGNPMHVDHTVVPVVPNIPSESGIGGILGGDITIGL